MPSSYCGPPTLQERTLSQRPGHTPSLSQGICGARLCITGKTGQTHLPGRQALPPCRTPIRPGRCPLLSGSRQGSKHGLLSLSLRSLSAGWQGAHQLMWVPWLEDGDSLHWLQKRLLGASQHGPSNPHRARFSRDAHSWLVLLTRDCKGTLMPAQSSE